jgi:hypothetical protein
MPPRRSSTTTTITLAGDDAAYYVPLRRDHGGYGTIWRTVPACGHRKCQQCVSIGISDPSEEGMGGGRAQLLCPMGWDEQWSLAVALRTMVKYESKMSLYYILGLRWNSFLLLFIL